MSASAARKCQGLHSPNCGSADCSFHSALLHSACALDPQCRAACAAFAAVLHTTGVLHFACAIDPQCSGANSHLEKRCKMRAGERKEVVAR